MDEILEELNLSSLKKNFQDNKVDPTDVLSLTEEDFRSLGVQTIGERARLRQRCKNLVSESMSESPVVQRLRMFQSQRRQRVSWRGPNSAASRSTTRRLHIGWKHKSRSTYTLVSAGKGGGSQTFDADKNLTLTDLENKVISIYFPSGVNQSQNLEISNLTYHLAHFNGKKLPNKINNEDFTVDLLYTHRKSYPIRIYLHTSPVEEQTVEEGCPGDEEPDAVAIDNTSVVMDIDESTSDDGDELLHWILREHTERGHSQDEIAITDEDLEQPTEREVSDESVHNILLRLNGCTNVGRYNLVNVTRDNVLPGALRAFNRASFNATNQLSLI
ncbi:uncharacterized protein LOC124262068 [Haliotis rubra]|uniref:uncharacterized protein LOC124262068 n=1 Tax=Haliotis rubra TaxID=36100 RepID=UPI001EE57539|nr:uncharacterized protein LOC124262068 [Haliotis rubra]